MAGLEFIPLQDIEHDPEAIVDRLLAVAGVDVDQDQEDGHQDTQTALPWHVRLSRRLMGDRAPGSPDRRSGVKGGTRGEDRRCDR
jgi:hypothetical protein